MNKNYIDEITDLTGDGIVNPYWSTNQRALADITTIVVHHDAEFRPTDYDDTDRYHQDAEYQNNTSIPGSVGLQYHYRIDNVGQITFCRPFTTYLWHCGDLDVNKASLAVCLDGDFEAGHQQPTREQYEALKQLLDYLSTPASGDFPATQADVYPHRQFFNTNCCGDNLVPFVNDYRNTSGNPTIPTDAQLEPADQPAPQPDVVSAPENAHLDGPKPTEAPQTNQSTTSTPPATQTAQEQPKTTHQEPPVITVTPVPTDPVSPAEQPSEPTSEPTSAMPHPKVVAGAMAGAVTSLILWGISHLGINVPAEQAAALTAIISFVMSYITSNK